MNASPRTLIRAVQRDLKNENSASKIGSGQTKDLMRAFIVADSVPTEEHRKILDHPSFQGCYPKVVDKVFYLERYASELPQSSNSSPATAKKAKKTEKNASLSQVGQYNSFNPTSFTGFEHCLICINITLFIGILLTATLLGLFFLFLNNALYLQEEIS
jgi:hypothetical protein